MPEISETALKVIEEDLAQIAKEVADAELVIAKKRNEVMKPIFEKRRAAFKQIPSFWPQVFENHHAFGSFLDENDGAVLKHLTDLWVEHDPENPRNYKITFTFSDNDYFKNKELVKEVVFDENDGPTSKAFKIEWKEGKDLTSKGSKRKRGAEDDAEDDEESFFAWFAGEDASLADMIAEDVFPEAFSHYLGESMNDDSDLESVDLEEDDEDEEDEDEEPKKKSAKK
ncbi:hypothetical protein DFQ27_008536 [Actinomortierella ambigua]|uniref:Uncharacterized protein n=1 Tax=Actinomortierella ambigua TaxID=1343610 RepID=A0A9P6UBB5_9FUNG|nr:hypothetical protein DFQ27_008536 [Actinomortierella ambigua]